MPGWCPGRDLDKEILRPRCAEGPFQKGAGVAAESRWRWTMVVVRQFSLVAISRIHPPAGIRSGWAPVPAGIFSRNGRHMAYRFLLRNVAGRVHGMVSRPPVADLWCMSCNCGLHVSCAIRHRQHSLRRDLPGKVSRRISPGTVCGLLRIRVLRVLYISDATL